MLYDDFYILDFNTQCVRQRSSTAVCIGAADVQQDAALVGRVGFGIRFGFKKMKLKESFESCNHLSLAVLIVLIEFSQPACT